VPDGTIEIKIVCYIIENCLIFLFILLTTQTTNSNDSLAMVLFKRKNGYLMTKRQLLNNNEELTKEMTEKTRNDDCITSIIIYN